MTNPKIERSKRRVSYYTLPTAGLCAAALVLILWTTLPLSAAAGQLIPNTTPKYVSTAANLGPTLWRPRMSASG